MEQQETADAKVTLVEVKSNPGRGSMSVDKLTYSSDTTASIPGANFDYSMDFLAGAGNSLRMVILVVLTIEVLEFNKSTRWIN